MIILVRTDMIHREPDPIRVNERKIKRVDAMQAGSLVHFKSGDIQRVRESKSQVLELMKQKGVVI